MTEMYFCLLWMRRQKTVLSRQRSEEILTTEEETGKFVRNQVKKPTQSPTMRWVFFLFRRITELAIPLDGTVEKSVANMTDELWDILSLMGKECEKYYV